MLLTQDKSSCGAKTLLTLSLTTVSIFCTTEILGLRRALSQNEQINTSDSFIGNNSNDNNVNQDTLQNQNITSSGFGGGAPPLNIQDNISDSFIGNNSNSNNVNQNTLQNQNVINNQNVVSFPDRVITPLNHAIYTPPNTENDFGFNMSVGVNTLDASNVTLYVGLIFQPGRTANHRARMANLLKQTELLEIEKVAKENQLRLLQLQIEEAEIRLQSIR